MDNEMFDLCDKMNYASLKLNLIDVETAVQKLRMVSMKSFYRIF